MIPGATHRELLRSAERRRRAALLVAQRRFERIMAGVVEPCRHVVLRADGTCAGCGTKP